MKRKILSLTLAVCMVSSVFSHAVFAQDMETTPEQQIYEAEIEDTTDDTETILQDTEAGSLQQSSDSSEETLTVEETEAANAAGDLHLVYSGHVQSYGWMSEVSDGEMCGTSGQAKRVEAIKVRLAQEVPDETDDSKMVDLTDAITYQAHVQTYGWMSWVNDGEEAGTHGQAKRVEAFRIKLKGAYAEKYDIYYAVHAQSYGWLGWAKNGEIAGTTGKAKRLEAIRIELVEKGGKAPEPLGNYTRGYLSDQYMGQINYTTHVQSYGWRGTSADGQVSGTSGEAKRMEAFKIWLDDSEELNGSVEYEAHVQSYGWMSAVQDGALCGTTGQAKRVEAIRIRLTGEVAEKYHVFYRVHSQSFGTLGWAKDGEAAGSEGFAKRLENMEIQLVAKDDTAKIEELSGGRAFVSKELIPGVKGATYTIVTPEEEAPAEEGTPAEDEATENTEETDDTEEPAEVGEWSETVSGKTIVLGTQGEAKEVNALKLDIDATGMEDSYQGSLSYQVLTKSGWSGAATAFDEVRDAEGKKIEAVKISLTGEAATYCDVYYRAYTQKYGWLGWARNGDPAGTQDYGYRLEGLEVRLVYKGADAPGSTAGAFMKYNKAFDSMTSRVQGLSSGTPYLIAVDCKNNICGVFTGSRGNWKLLYAWQCSTGAAGTPTCKGQYSIIYKKPYFGDRIYTVWYASFFQSAGYAFHSVMYRSGSKTQLYDGRLGMNLSHGCVRLAMENAQWIHSHCANGTKVYTY